MLISTANNYADSLVNYLKLLTYNAKKVKVGLRQDLTDSSFDLGIRFIYPDPRPVLVHDQLTDVVEFDVEYSVDTTYDITEYAPLYIAEANRLFTIWQLEHI
jgi:hypothetical protein